MIHFLLPQCVRLTKPKNIFDFYRAKGFSFEKMTTYAGGWEGLE